MILKEKIAVITGAGQGIGRAIAEAFAREGAHLVLAARNLAALEETRDLVTEYQREVLVLPLDLRQEESVRMMAEQALAHFKQVDILVNNSGIAGPTAPLWEISPEQWRETLDVDLNGPYFCCHAFLPGMIARRSGAILNIGSGIAKRPLPGRTPYTASKAGLSALTKTLALDTGPFGIRVNLISPGPVDGERLEMVLQRQAAARNIPFEAVKAGIAGNAALKRFVFAEEVANLAVYLASEAASGITGQDIDINAGLP